MSLLEALFLINARSSSKHRVQMHLIIYQKNRNAGVPFSVLKLGAWIGTIEYVT